MYITLADHTVSITGYDDENGPCHWSQQRFENIIHLRQQALDTARRIWADSLFVSLG